MIRIRFNSYIGFVSSWAYQRDFFCGATPIHWNESFGVIPPGTFFYLTCNRTAGSGSMTVHGLIEGWFEDV